MGQQLVLIFDHRSKLFAQDIRIEKFIHLDADLRKFIGKERSNTGLGRTESRGSEALFLVDIQIHMIGHHDLCPVRDEDFRIHPALADGIEFIHQFGYIQRNTVTKNIHGIGIADTAGQ